VTVDPKGAAVEGRGKLASSVLGIAVLGERRVIPDHIAEVARRGSQQARFAVRK
jgi:hypothetical protein